MVKDNRSIYSSFNSNFCSYNFSNKTAETTKRSAFTIKICEVSEFCGMPFSVDKDVYADEILITSNLTYYNPRKLKFFIWEK